MSLSKLKSYIGNQISIAPRRKSIAVYYLLFLSYTVRKKSMEEAARFCGLHKSQFSRFLFNHCEDAVSNLKKLSKKQAKQFSKILKALADGALPWKIAIIIDSTLQNRSSRHSSNAKRFNHGQGFVIGHQWTNIVLLINGTVIPLPPIPFHSKKYCRKEGIEYQTEHDLVVEFLNKLNLTEYIGQHTPAEVVVLGDSGYDCKVIENAIQRRKWKFIVALSKTRTVKSAKQHQASKESRGWSQVGSFFKNQRWLKWITVRFYVMSGTKRRRKDFRVRQIIGYLRDVGKVKLICSEFRKRPDGRRKYLACNDLKATAREILLGYRLRWAIEIFHKDVKQYLGFENVAATRFKSIEAHVHWVYCAYILLNREPPGVPDEAATIREKQLAASKIINQGKIYKWRQVLTQFNGKEALMNEFFQVIEGSESSMSLMQ